MRRNYFKIAAAAVLTAAICLSGTVSVLAKSVATSDWDESPYYVLMKVEIDYLDAYASADSNISVEEMRLNGKATNPYAVTYLHAYDENAYYISNSASLQLGVDYVEADYYFYTSEGYSHSQIVSTGN